MLVLSSEDLMRSGADLSHHRIAFVQAFDASLIQGKIVRNVLISGKRADNFANTTAMHDICEFIPGVQNFYVPPSTGVAMEVLSANAQDGAAGTGVLTVRIDYLDANGAEQTTVVTMNGTTPVSVAGGALIRRVQWMHALTTGTGGVAAGNIICRKTTTTEPIEQITAGGNMSLSCRYTVPLGYSAYVDEWSANAAANAQDMRLRATCEKTSRALLPGVFLYQDEIMLAAGVDASGLSVPMLKFPALCDIKVSTISATQNNNKVSASFDMVLVQD